MRKFNTEEQNFIKLLAKISNEEAQFFGYFLQKYFFKKESNTALIIISQQKEALLFFKKEVFDNLLERKQELMKFFRVLYLTEYLKQERWIDILPDEAAKNIPVHFMKEDFDSPKNENGLIILNRDKVHIKLTDPSKIYNSKDEIIYEAVKLEQHTYDLIMKNFMGLLFVSEDLIQFVKRGFISEEDRKYKNGQFAVWTSILIAFTFGFLGIYKPFSENSDIKPISNKLDTIIYNQVGLKKGILKLVEDSIEIKDDKVLATIKNIVHLADSTKNEDGSK